MSITDCAELVKQADEDRFLSVMAAKPELRAALFTLYAFNAEISKAAWASAEPMLCQMRLQYLRDMIDGIYAGELLAKIPVAKPLAELIENGGVTQQMLVEMIEARDWDLDRQAFENIADFNKYLQHTAGNLMVVAARTTGCSDDGLKAVQIHGHAMGLAKFLIAVPELKAHHRIPLIDESPNVLAELANNALQAMRSAEPPKAARAALRAGFDTSRVLKLVRRDPDRVLEGLLQASPFRRKTGLLLMSLRG